MSSYRWTMHRLVDAAGKQSYGRAPISLWWVARAAAEETLQGSPMVSAWLKLFKAHLSAKDRYTLRWRDDLAESAELRRAYSGLYGRFFARALLSNHVGLTRFLSLRRNGISVPGDIEVRRSKAGDIPDWLAWDDRNSRYVLCEAKGSLTANDFLSANQPSCVSEGKKQFERVTCTIGTKTIQPGEWVAATRWATDRRGGQPTTLLWDPPVEEPPFKPEEAELHRAAMTRAWLDSIAPALGWTNANDLLSVERQREALMVSAEPGDLSEEEDWSTEPPDSPDLWDIKELPWMMAPYIGEGIGPEPSTDLTESNFYRDRGILTPRAREASAHKRAYVAATVTRFGVQPIRSPAEFETMQYHQERAIRLQEPAMLVGIPLGLDSKRHSEEYTWLDGAGMAPPNDLAVFDLRRVHVAPLDQQKL